MADKHTHKQPTYSANNKLVCAKCVLEEDQKGNECFCKCHAAGNLICPKCKAFHKVV